MDILKLDNLPLLGLGVVPKFWRKEASMKTLSAIVLLLLCISLLTSGCATIFSSEPETINVTSDPPGAKFQYGPFSGTTPTTIVVPRKALGSFASFRKEGYEEKTVPVVTGTQGVIWWGILFWPSLIIDFVTGNAYKLDPPLIHAVLDQKK